MVNAALFIIAKTWKQPKCPSPPDERIKKIWCVCVCVLVAQLYLTLQDAVDCSLPDSSVHEISQSRILEWVAISSSRGSSQPRDQTHISCIGRQIFLPLSHQGSPIEYYSVIKKKEIMSFAATWMDLEICHIK